jgi:hypothetical protein
MNKKQRGGDEKRPTQSLKISIDRRVAALTDQVAQLKAALRRAHRDLSINDAFRDIRHELENRPRTPPAWTVEHARVGKGISPEVPVALWADWHIGEVVQAAEINGYNRYDMRTAEERVRRLVDSTIRLAKSKHIAGQYPGAVVCLTGDFVSGGLHPELLKTDEQPILACVVRTEEILMWALGRMADEFGKLYIPCVAGNHGRNTAKPEFKQYYLKNFDWLIYRHLARDFAGDPRFHFDIRPSNDVSFSVYGMRYLLVHGDMLGVRGGDGIIGSAGPIIRGEVKRSGQAAALGTPFDKLLMGHWHQRLWLPRATVSGTLKGFDEYARLQLGAKPDRPTQPLWFVHPSHGETAHWDIYCDDKPSTARAWVTWEKAS